MNQPMLSFELQISATQAINYILTLALVYYILVNYVLRPKPSISPEERAKRRYIQAHREVLRTMNYTDRQEM